MSLLISCGSYSKLLKPSALPVEINNEGIVVLSATRSIKGKGLFARNGITSNFLFEKNDDKKITGSFKSRLDLVYDDELENDYLKDKPIILKNGVLNSIKLPAGQYTIYDWSLFIPEGINSYHITPNIFEKIEFTVKANQVTYLGNLHLDTIYGKNFLNISIPAGAKFSCSNQAEKDLKLFKTHYAQFESWPISQADVDCTERDLPYKKL